MLAEPALQAQSAQGRVNGTVIDLTDMQAIARSFEEIGEFDHLIITSGAITRVIDFRTEDLSKHKGTHFTNASIYRRISWLTLSYRRIRCQILGRSCRCSEGEAPGRRIHHVYYRYVLSSTLLSISDRSHRRRFAEAPTYLVPYCPRAGGGRCPYTIPRHRTCTITRKYSLSRCRGHGSKYISYLLSPDIHSSYPLLLALGSLPEGGKGQNAVRHGREATREAYGRA